MGPERTEREHLGWKRRHTRRQERACQQRAWRRGVARPAAAAPVLVLVLVLVLASCSSTGADRAAADRSPTVDLSSIETGEAVEVVPAPRYPAGPWSAEVAEELGSSVASLLTGSTPTASLEALVSTEDPRLAWALADLLRFTQGGETGAAVTAAMEELTGMAIDPEQPWSSAVDQLISWDLPVPPQYVTFKQELYGTIDPRWRELISETSTIDWRHVGWGGVQIDDRPAGSSEPCSCIPALDDPAVTPAAGGDWYPDDRLIFGVVVEGEARAYPKNIMEVHEMVNDTLGGRRIGIPYCTLCGSAQAYYLDDLPGDLPQPVLRTSGLLIRSNKMMYDLQTSSFIDTFVGEATSGPLAEAGVTLEPLSVVTTTWREWRAAHPDTTIVAEDGGLDRSYQLDPLGGRDDDGPIFPIGAPDPRLPVQEPVLGVVTEDGPVAFHVATAVELLDEDEEIVIGGVALALDGGGLRALGADGGDVGSHQALWFAWSQFHPDTGLWPHDYQPQESG